MERFPLKHIGGENARLVLTLMVNNVSKQADQRTELLSSHLFDFRCMT